jgi:hypothetical protein
MNYEGPRFSYPKGWRERLTDHPLAARFGAMIMVFAALVPIAHAFSGGGGEVIRAGELPGAVVGEPVVRKAPRPTASKRAATTRRAASVARASAPVAAAAVVAASAAPPAPQARQRTYSQASSPPHTSAPWKPPRTTPVTSAWHPPVTHATPRPATTATTSPPPPPTTIRKVPVTTPALQPPPSRTYTYAQVEAIIRSVWPDNLEDHAIFIADRESHLISTTHNYCCYGIFALYFDQLPSSIRSAFGLTSASQLYDPLLNSRVAYALYLRSGWAPWNL